LLRHHTSTSTNLSVATKVILQIRLPSKKLVYYKQGQIILDSADGPHPISLQNEGFLEKTNCASRIQLSTPTQKFLSFATCLKISGLLASAIT
jgi:hypothetical protein